MIPIPNTELVTDTDSEATLISYHQGICKAAKLNHTGYRVWQLIDGKRTIREIASLIITSCGSIPDLNAESVHEDVNGFIIVLAKEGFVRLESHITKEYQQDDQKH